MRKTISISLLILFVLVGVNSLHAQVKKIVNNSKEVLDDLNDTENFPMSKSEQKSFGKINSDLTNNLNIINNSNKTDDDKDKAIDKLFDDRDKSILDLFGNDQTRYEKFQKKTSKKLKKTKRKAKINLVKVAL